MKHFHSCVQESKPRGWLNVRTHRVRPDKTPSIYVMITRERYLKQHGVWWGAQLSHPSNSECYEDRGVFRQIF